MKKVFYNIVLIILLVIPFAVKADADVDSNGDASIGGTTLDGVTGIRISGDGDYGIRITIVDENGNRRSVRTADYWQTAFSSSIIRQMPGATYKTAIVNQGGLSYTPLKNFVSYTYGVDENGQLLYDANHIDGAGTGSWRSKHITLENFIDKEIKKDVNGDSCENPSFLNDVGFNICEYIKNNRCEELKKMYVLIEPLVRMHDDNYVYYVFSGTEAANFFAASHAAGEISTKVYKNNFGGSVYRNLINMYLTNQPNDSLKYQLKSNGSIYAYFKSQPTTNNAGNEPSSRMDIFAGKTKDSNGNPWGSSMQIVWLGRAAEECETKECCVPCDPEDQVCIEAAGDNWHEKDPYCCYETGEISEDGTIEACVPADDYWASNQDFFEQYCTPCCIPSLSNDYCCDTSNKVICDGSERKSWSEYWSDKQELYKQFCEPDEDKCEKVPSLTDPEIDIVDCDDDNTNNISHFRDPVFNSENGQFKDFNSIKKIVEAVKSNSGKIPAEWLEKIANENEDNTFAAIVYGNNAGDERYTTEVNKFCKIYCQEIFEVELPDNYPYVEAGRYFKWTIKDSKDDIAKASAAKLCAMDIDLDKAIDSYLYISQAAQLALANEINFQFNGHTGVGDVYGGNPYERCEGDNSFKTDYVSIAVKGGGAHGVPALTAGLYSGSFRSEKSNCPRYECDGDGNCVVYYDNPRYYAVDQYANLTETGEGLYSKGVVYKWSSPSGGCYAPNPIYDYRVMGERPNGTDGTENVENIPAINATWEYGYYIGGISPKAWCENTLNDYNMYVKGPGEASDVGTTGFSSMVYDLYSNMKQCNDIGDALMNSAASYLEIDMGLELKYQTLFKEHKYSTETDQIVSNLTENDKYHNSACFYHDEECMIDLDDDGRNDTPFYMDPSSSLMQNGGDEKQLTCDGIVENWGIFPIQSSVENPNVYYGLEYNPNKLEMLSICNGNLDGTFNLGCNKISENDSVYKFYDNKISYWSTVYMGFMSASELFQLDEKINACVCKDGEVLDKSDDGSCSCIREVSYKGFKEEYNNYQELPDGTLTVEFMNGSGLYPIDLRYWHIGSIDENGEGHFDQFLDEYSNGKCSKEDGCMYGDPNGVCRMIVKNKIIASPDDTGICEEPPCDDDDDDDIDDYGECIVGGKPDPNCSNVSGLNIIYRVVDLDNPFPGSDGNSREPGTNWTGKEDIIKNNRETSGMGVYSLEPLYSLTLTPAAIKEIRKDNHENMDGDYLKGTLVYPSNSPDVYGGGYSLFVHETLESIAVGYGGNFSIKIENDNRFSDILKTR